jgi:hypothetical protein
VRVVRWKLFHIATRRRVARVVMVIAVRVGHGMMCAGLVVLQLVGVILPQRGVEILLLVRAVNCQYMQVCSYGRAYSLLMSFWIKVSSFSLCHSVRRYRRISRSIVVRSRVVHSAMAGNGPVQ